MKYAQGGKFCRLASVNGGSGRRRGFTLFELVGIIFIASSLALILFDRLLFYQAQVEKTVMEMTVINIRSGLRLRVAELMMQDRMAEVGSLVHENPIKWLAAPPPNYIGSLKYPDQSVIPPDSWYFDSRRQELVYQPPHAGLFEFTQVPPQPIRYRVSVVMHPQGKNAGSAPSRAEGAAFNQISQ